MDDVQRFGSIAVLTSGGDAQGMNAAVRAVVRTARHRGVDVFGVMEGYRGLVAGGDAIRRLRSHDVGGILHRGGSVIGSARSAEFRTRDGRRQAARHLLERGVGGLVVVGGDGSLTGADLFRREWPELLDELVEAGQVDRHDTDAHRLLRVVGLVGSIDNDMFGTDMTIGADTALHRITEAVDAIHSTASSHQRSFVIEVMGRRCGYLALMAALATGANWIFIPEFPPESDWPEAMSAALRAGRRSGRRQNLVIVAEGAQDREGRPITAEQVKVVLQDSLGEDTRVTVLGHVQRGGAPSAFDRNLATLLGAVAVERLLSGAADEEPLLLGIRGHPVAAAPLQTSVEQTHALADLIASRRYDAALAARGSSFAESFRTLRTLTRAQPRPARAGQRRLRLAVVHAGEPAPGMNTAARVAVRLGLDAGHEMLAIRGGLAGLRAGAVEDMVWMSVTEWVSRGGAELGTSSYVPSGAELAQIADQVAAHRLDGLLIIGGWAGYEAALAFRRAAPEHAALRLPIACLPASINNDLPGTLSIGADTALNTIVAAVDKIKQSGAAARRCYVVEVMGGDCGYLALGSGLATGAERVYLPEEGITLEMLRRDVAALTTAFERGQRIGLIIRSERAETFYTTDLLRAVFEKEGGDEFEVFEAILGHTQQGGNPSPFDRIQATRLAARSVDFLAEQAGSAVPAAVLLGLRRGEVVLYDIDGVPGLVASNARRPAEQWWLDLRPIGRVMAGQGRDVDA